MTKISTADKIMFILGMVFLLVVLAAAVRAFFSRWLAPDKQLLLIVLAGTFFEFGKVK